MLDSDVLPASTTPTELGLSSVALGSCSTIKAALGFQGACRPPCRIIPKLKGLGFDIIGPSPLNDALVGMIRGEKPSLFSLRIDLPGDDDAFAWIGRIWADFAIPTVVISTGEDGDIFTESVSAGAFGVLREDADTPIVQATLLAAAQRGAALHAAHRRVSQLETNLANLRSVEQAKWILVQRDGMTEPEAHLALQTVARNSRTPLAEVAQRVLDGGSL